MAFDLKAYIREVPDYPKPGVSFKDLSPLLASAEGFREATAQLVTKFRQENIEGIVATEARGFLWGGALAQALGTGLILVRKPKKLPRETISEDYELEYGTDRMEIHKDAVSKGDRILLVDDLLATGGTIEACCRLVESLGGTIVGVAFLIMWRFGSKKD